MGWFDNDDEAQSSHEAAYNEGRDDAQEDTLPEQVVNGIADMALDILIPDPLKDSEYQSYSHGYADQSSGQNPKDE